MLRTSLLCLICATLVTQNGCTMNASQNLTAQNAPEVDVDEQNVPTGQMRRGMVVGSADGKSREQRVYEKTIARIEPDLVGRPNRLPLYVQLYKATFTSDRRLFHFDAEAAYDNTTQTVTLTGTAEYPEHKAGLERMLHFMGFENIQNQIKLLPDPALKGNNHAIVTAQQSFIYSATTEPRETITQTIFGDTLYVLAATENDTLLVHSPDGYTGYITAADTMLADAAGIADWAKPDQAVLTREHQLTNGLLLRIGTSLPVVTASSEIVTVSLPDRTTTDLPADAVAIHPNKPDPRSEAAIQTAKSMMGIPYVWGGIASDGVDCSGMVQISHRSQGVYLPRDADMQGTMGAITGTRWHRDLIRRGDIMLFLSNRGTINHVGIYLGDGQYIESASGGVQITSLNPGDPNYSEKRDQSFCFAKRLFK